MQAKSLKTFTAKNTGQWRKWLADHHDSESEVWLVFYKRHTKRPSIAHTDALDEALCFGWIDSLVKRLDEERYAVKFTPRKPDSKWSAINRKRYAALQASGRLMPAGVARAPTDRIAVPPSRRAWPLPDYIAKTLRKNATAWNTFQQLAPSHRRKYIGWIDSAKRQETKMKRLKEAIDLLAAGKKLGLK